VPQSIGSVAFAPGLAPPPFYTFLLCSELGWLRVARGTEKQAFY